MKFLLIFHKDEVSLHGINLVCREKRKMKNQTSRSKPEIIEVSEKALEAIESRILSNSLSVEEKKIILSIMSAYS